MPIEIRLGIPDLAKVRFTTDVAWETAASVEMQPTLHDGKPGILLKSDGLENLVQSCGTA